MRFGDKKLIFFLLGLIFIIAIMGLTLSQREAISDRMSWPEKILKDTVSWTQGLIYKPASAVAGFFDDLAHLNVIYEENQALRQTLAHYARDRAKLNTLEEENLRLMEALQFTERQRERHHYRYHVAHVTAVNTDPYNPSITINLGEQDGVKKDWVVVSVDGILGRVVSTTPFHSTVQLITATDDGLSGIKAIPATILGSEHVSYGIIESYNREEELLLMTKIKQDDPLKKGDLVISSGLGTVFPEGLVIGTVELREVGEFGITDTAKIKPAATFTHLREVFVIEVPGM